MHSAFISIVLLSLTPVLASCVDISSATKLSAEENAYFDTFDGIYSAACDVGKVIQVGVGEIHPGATMCVMKSATNPAGCGPYRRETKDEYVDRLSAVLETETIEILESVESRLPPPGLEHVHGTLLEALRLERSSAPDTKNTDQSVDRFRAVCSSKMLFDAFVSRRSPIATERPYFVEIQTGFLSTRIDSAEGLSVQPQVSISTPMGSLTGGFRSPSGVSKMVVQIDDKERHFFFDRPFVFKVPKNSELTYTGTDTVYLSIKTAPILPS